MSIGLLKKKKLNHFLLEEESKDRKGTITVGGKFLSGNDGREIGHVLVPHSLLRVDVQAHRHTAVQESPTVLRRTRGTQWAGPFQM